MAIENWWGLESVNYRRLILVKEKAEMVGVHERLKKKKKKKKKRDGECEKGKTDMVCVNRVNGCLWRVKWSGFEKGEI